MGGQGVHPPWLVLSSVSGWGIEIFHVGGVLSHDALHHGAVWALFTDALPNQWLALVDDPERSGHTSGLGDVSLRHILRRNGTGVVHGRRQGGVIGLLEFVFEQHGGMGIGCSRTGSTPLLKYKRS